MGYSFWIVVLTLFLYGRAFVKLSKGFVRLCKIRHVLMSEQVRTAWLRQQNQHKVSFNT